MKIFTFCLSIIISFVMLEGLTRLIIDDGLNYDIEMMKKNPESKEFLTNEIFIPFDEYSKIEIEQIISMINQINQNY